ncbi:MAG: hypothetical protein MO846_09610 [Candidatus Devosia symbiotica]|nr:hypothetical protein [Candidatus Devosia symbiotica]
MDYILEEAEDGQEAFDKCRAEMPDAIAGHYRRLQRIGLGGPAQRLL